MTFTYCPPLELPNLESKTFEDIRNGFIKHLNLPLLYEFALDNEFAN